MIEVRCLLLGNRFDDFVSNSATNDSRGRRDLSEDVVKVYVGNGLDGRDLIAKQLQLSDVIESSGR